MLGVWAFDFRGCSQRLCVPALNLCAASELLASHQHMPPHVAPQGARLSAAGNTAPRASRITRHTSHVTRHTSLITQVHHNSKNKRSLQWTLLMRESGHCPPPLQSRKISRVMCARASGRAIDRMDSDGSAFTCGAFWDRDLAANGWDGAGRPVVVGTSACARQRSRAFFCV